MSHAGSEAVCGGGISDFLTTRFAVLAPCDNRTEPKLEEDSTGLRELLTVRLRDASRSRSRSSMISLSVRLRIFELEFEPAALAARLWLALSEDGTRGVAVELASVLICRAGAGRGGGRATSLPLSFSPDFRLKAVGFTFSLSRTTTSSSA